MDNIKRVLDFIDNLGLESFERSELVHELLKADGQIGIIWSVQDVISRAKNHGILNITNEQAMEVLKNVEHSHDCEFGVTWETFDYHIQDVTGEEYDYDYEPEEEDEY